LSSDSVGSTIKVPGTGKDMVGAWKPKSISLLAISYSLTPVDFLRLWRSIINSCEHLSLFSIYEILK